MEFFAASIASHGLKVLLDKYNQTLTYGGENSPFTVIHDVKTNPDLISMTETILKESPHQPSLVELLDIRGSLQTSAQYSLRSCYKIYKNIFKTKCRTHYNRELVFLPDGGNIALDWVACPNGSDDDIKMLNDENVPLVIMLHGLLGDSQSEYMYHFAKEIKQAGYQPVMYVARGCGDLEITSGHTFGGAITADLYYAIKGLRNKFPNRKFFMVGYSLGAAVTINYLGNTTDYSEITAAMAICPPWNIENTINRPSKLFGIWSFLLALPAKFYFMKHYKTLHKFDKALIESVNYWKIIFAETMAKFDSLIYPIYYKHVPIVKTENNKHTIEWEKKPYVDSNDYYRDGTPIYFSKKVTVPLISVTSVDDPICPEEDCPSPQYNNTDLLGENIVVIKTKFGGHLGFAEHSLTHAWTDKLVLNFLSKFH